MKTSDIDLGEKFMGLFKGMNGVGKTCAAVTFPKPLKVFDFDGRMNSVKHQWPNEDVDYDLYGPTNFHKFRDEFEALQDRCPWQTIVVTLTSMCNTIITYQLKMKGQENKKSKGGLVVPSFDEYNGETTIITQVLDIAKILPCHVIFEGHPVQKIDITGGVTKRYSSLVSYGTKVASFAPGYFNEIYHFYLDKPLRVGDKARRIALTEGTDEEFAKTALPLPAKLDYTNARFFDVISGELESHGITIKTRG